MRGATLFLGVSECTFGTLLFLGFWNKRLGVLGALEALRTLQLVYDTRQADYDWIHNFRLSAEVEGVGTMFASGECPWYAKDKAHGPDQREITGSTTSVRRPLRIPPG